MNLFTILCAASLATVSTSTPQPTETASDETGSISGKIVWEGEKPEPKPKLAIKEAETTGCKHGGSGVDAEDRSLMIAADGGVANVVLTVTIKDAAPSVPAEPIVMDQQGCKFIPRVLVVPVGGTLRFGNSDDTNHNIHTFAKKNQPINKQVSAGSNLDLKLDKAEVIDVKCDIHTWMKGFVVVTDATQWAVSGEDGSFKIEGLPAGEYTVEWWHEELGKDKTDKVVVEAGKEATLTHKVGEKKAGGKKKR